MHKKIQENEGKPKINKDIIKTARSVEISMFQHGKPLKIGSPKGSRTPDSSKITKCSNSNAFKCV